MSAGYGSQAQGPAAPAAGGPYSGTPPPPAPVPPPGFQPYPSSGSSWVPPPASMRMPSLPKGIDLGIIIIGLGALLTLIGFLFGSAATGQLTSGGSASAYRAWLGAFFVLTGIGLFLVIGGWLYRTVRAAR